MTSKQQNRSIPIPQPALLLLIVILLFLGGNVFGATMPFADDFETYSVKDLSGQGNWATSSPYISWEVSTAETKSGSKAIHCNYGYCKNTKTGTGIANGSWIFYTYIQQDYIGFWLKENTTEVCRVDVSIPSNVRFFGGAGWYDTGWSVSADDWQPIQIEWNSTTDECRIKYATSTESIWSPWLDSYNSFSEVNAVDIFNTATSDYTRIVDFIGDEFFVDTATLEITSPIPEFELYEAFDLEGNFDLKGEDWEKIMVIFEQWHASSTCPEYQDEDWETEYSNGWFISQSMPFFSDIFTSTTTGNFSILIDDLRIGNYNCTKCFFINEIARTISSQKCQGYTLIITADIGLETAQFYYPFLSWQNYYATSSEEFATSTPLFENMANALTPIANKMGDFILYAKEYFDSSEAMAKGNELGQAIPKARGYLEMIDDFIGLPLSSFVIFYFLTIAVVISYKVILQIIKLLKP